MTSPTAEQVRAALAMQHIRSTYESLDKLTEKAIRRGVFKSVPDLIAAIEAYLQANNNDPKPFVWTATAEEILEKVSRGRVALASIPANNETPH